MSLTYLHGEWAVFPLLALFVFTLVGVGAVAVMVYRMWRDRRR